MTGPRTRGAAIAAKCRECIHDRQAAGTWRTQVATCQCTDCALWRFRPLPGNAADWLRSRNPADLPEGWVDLPQETAARLVDAPKTALFQTTQQVAARVVRGAQR